MAKGFSPPDSENAGRDAPEEAPRSESEAEIPTVEIDADEDFTRRIRVARPIRVGANQ